MSLPFNQESWIWYTCAIAMIGARIMSRSIHLHSIKSLQLDDWIMSLFVTVAYTALIVCANKYIKAQSNLLPPGFNVDTLTAYDLKRREFGSKMVVVVEQAHIAVIWSCKACLLMMYHRLTRIALRNENIAIKLLSVYVALGFVVMEVLYFAAWCRPISEYWAVPTSSSQCNALVNHRITKAVFNLSSDIVMLTIALQMLIRSLLPLKRKLILCGIFSLGIFVIVASILNSYHSFRYPYRQTWTSWYVRESSTAVLVANLPFTWTALRQIYDIGDFDAESPPAWTYHAARPTQGRKSTPPHPGRKATSARRCPSFVNQQQGMTLVDSMGPLHQSVRTPSNTRRSLEKEEEEEEEDFVTVPVQPGRVDVQDVDLEVGAVQEAHLRRLTLDDEERCSTQRP